MLNLIPTAAFNLRFVFQQLASVLAASSLVLMKAFLFVSHDILPLQEKKNLSCQVLTLHYILIKPFSLRTQFAPSFFIHRICLHSARARQRHAASGGMQ